MVTAEALRTDIEKHLGVSVYAEFDAKYPECLCAVVLGDVGPEKMGEVCDMIRKAGDEKLRLCANVIEEDHIDSLKQSFAAGGFKGAWEASWGRNVATVRMG